MQDATDVIITITLFTSNRALGSTTEAFRQSSRFPNTFSWRVHCLKCLPWARTSAGTFESCVFHGLFLTASLRLSSLNCSKIYNECLGFLHSHIANQKKAYLETFHLFERPFLRWQTSLDIRDEHILNGFFLYSLLLDKAERGTRLWLIHDESSQKDRLKAALAERNKLMEGIGQENYMHACSLCFIVDENEAGELSKFLLISFVSEVNFAYQQNFRQPFATV